ncbi:PREDICTED: NKG2-A/NKG2-B type II integral membrane protein-like [Chrysochloris asiatica]|uniref:NKG2-A/NKG2-B type II integral membrane protein-like n=1 Tax=Chrysochloris asiatica TaxID=185453 RepID=A0A9B0X154_CHRAS|nr:PREDICTED: NKG2-A/NKG2-B type II integral membrane protein-like [Chrysochloris asiatica]
MNNQTKTYSDINLIKNSKRHQMKSKDAKKSISISEQEIRKLTAGILGVTCIVLMASIEIVRIINPEILITMRITLLCLGTVILEKNRVPKVILNLSSVHHCGHCPEDWISYSNNCYFISSKKKSWTESQTACALKKSNLISMENDEEMNKITYPIMRHLCETPSELESEHETLSCKEHPASPTYFDLVI